MSTDEQEYVLGTQRDELDRLGLQHTLWRAQAHKAWERAGFGPGHRLLDIGAGPGYATFDLAQLVGPKGRIIAVDGSQRFMDYLKARPRPEGASPIEVKVADLEEVEFPELALDGAYARWVLCFLSDPGAAIARVAKALRPGGTFVIQDYVHYLGMKLAPSSDLFRMVVSAVDASWREHGGDPDVACRLPTLLEKAGFVVQEISPISRIATPSSPLWNWPSSFFKNYVPTLVANGHLSASDASSFEVEWQTYSKSDTAFFVTPTVLDIIATRRS